MFSACASLRDLLIREQVLKESRREFTFLVLVSLYVIKKGVDRPNRLSRGGSSLDNP
jgi:hypothetical protein